jgi:hypothetical protein
MVMKSIVLVALLWTALSAAALFAQDAEDDFQTDGEGTITRYVGWNDAVNIPARIGGAPVTGIGKRAFAESELVSVILPDSVISIGYGAFHDNQLMSLTIGSGLTSIGAGAFADNHLTSVTIPGGLTSIGEYAFYGNPLTSVTIPANVSLDTLSFPNSFNKFYNYNNGKKAGVYTYSSGRWTFQPK